ncbi:arsenic resistance N-acetyltransferase ArsN2 [Fulvivirgaceae bacterium BMA12]|uniref:Arsenic resistance N-acetyltransferase ArsN2 n=1 Tax=Agaribacillus aureus TaxID=3051825 RepID=A0ABT8KZ26_9BACT|nr:arsenic resistance N-acetyltransferase ArsN2 [Fulvivirgaceae bacterium BMA12]
MTKAVLNIQAATQKDIPEIKQWLISNDLPTEDIDGTSAHFFLFYQQNQLVGMSGIERFETVGLLRSVVVKRMLRNNNVGFDLVSMTIAQAKKMGIHQLYLLTTTADKFFRKLGFVDTDRATAPECIKLTHEFADLCPESASFMTLNIH